MIDRALSTQEKANALSSKIIMILIGILTAIGGWFGNVCYTKLNSIELDTKLILIANASQKTELDDLKEQFREHLHHPVPAPENINYPNYSYPNKSGRKKQDQNKGYTILTEYITPDENDKWIQK